MSSADPIDIGPPTLASGNILRRGRSSADRPADNSDPAWPEDTDARSEKPQANPEDRKADRKPPEADQTQEQGPKGVKGAFQKHPIAMVRPLGGQSVARGGHDPDAARARASQQSDLVLLQSMVKESLIWWRGTFSNVCFTAKGKDADSTAISVTADTDHPSGNKCWPP
jgi:hypothetical protein